MILNIAATATKSRTQHNLVAIEKHCVFVNEWRVCPSTEMYLLTAGDSYQGSAVTHTPINTLLLLSGPQGVLRRGGGAHLGVDKPTGGLVLHWLGTEPEGSLGRHWGSDGIGSRRPRPASHRLGRAERRPITPLMCVLVY